MSKHVVNPDLCTACTVCVAHCPVAEVVREYRGPKLSGPASERLRLLSPEDDMSLDFCSNCKNCDISCPSGVPISTLNMKARAKMLEGKPEKQGRKMMAHGEQMGKLVSRFPGAAALVNLGMGFGKSLGMMDMVGISSKAPLPKYASTSFYKQFKAYKQPTCKAKVVFYPGCTINFNAPEIGMDLVKVLNANNIEVLVDEDFVCCGSPLVVGGYLGEAKENARKNTGLMSKWRKQGYPVITACTSCGLMLKQEYQELFSLDGMEENAENIYDIMEYLSMLDDEGKLNTNFGEVKEAMLYHAPCHLRAQGMGLPALDVLSLIPNVKIENAGAGCCGMSGSYGMQANKREISLKIGEKLFNRIRDAKVNTVVSDCGTCRLQITDGAKVKTFHPISIIARAYEAK